MATVAVASIAQAGWRNSQNLSQLVDFIMQMCQPVRFAYSSKFKQSSSKLKCVAVNREIFGYYAALLSVRSSEAILDTRLLGHGMKQATN